MIKEIPLISGNLLDFPTHCETDPDKYVGINNIAHSCNCQNVMGGGIAKQIKDRYPKAFEADAEFHNKEYNDAMKAMQEDLLFNQHELNVRQVVGLPYGISCGLAGGKWKIIKAIIEDIFLDSMIECYIVKFEWAEYYNFIDKR